MASIQTRHRVDGTPIYRVQFRVDGALLSDSFPTMVGALEYQALVEKHGGVIAREILAARNSDRPVVILERYLADHIDRLTGVTDGTRKDYRAMAARHINPYLGQLPLEAVDRKRLEKWVNDLTPLIAGKTLRNVHSLLSAALNRAVYEGLVPANLAKGVRLPSPDHNKTEMVTLTPNEFTALLDAFPDHWQPFVAALAGTGMRWGEATALTVGSVDLDSSPPTLRVQQAWKRTGLSQRELGAPKTRKGRRVISLSPGVVRILRPLIEGRPASALVFTALEGGVIHHGTFYPRVWKPAVRKFAGDVQVDGKWMPGPGKRPRIHDLRHTHATWMLAAGRPITTVQRRLGHEDITTTVNTYGHAMPDDLRGDAQAVEEALAGALPVVEDPPRDRSVALQKFVEVGDGLGVDQSLTDH